MNITIHSVSNITSIQIKRKKACRIGTYNNGIDNYKKKNSMPGYNRISQVQKMHTALCEHRKSCGSAILKIHWLIEQWVDFVGPLSIYILSLASKYVVRNALPDTHSPHETWLKSATLVSIWTIFLLYVYLSFGNLRLIHVHWRKFCFLQMLPFLHFLPVSLYSTK